MSSSQRIKKSKTKSNFRKILRKMFLENSNFRNEENKSTGFDWLTDYQQNFDTNQKKILRKVPTKISLVLS